MKMETFYKALPPRRRRSVKSDLSSCDSHSVLRFYAHLFRIGFFSVDSELSNYCAFQNSYKDTGVHQASVSDEQAIAVVRQ